MKNDQIQEGNGLVNIPIPWNIWDRFASLIPSNVWKVSPCSKKRGEHGTPKCSCKKIKSRWHPHHKNVWFHSLIPYFSGHPEIQFKFDFFFKTASPGDSIRDPFIPDRWRSLSHWKGHESPSQRGRHSRIARVIMCGDVLWWWYTPEDYIL